MIETTKCSLYFYYIHAFATLFLLYTLGSKITLGRESYSGKAKLLLGGNLLWG
ncbi:MAG: hypothetical protein KBC30_07190 [Planctomycetes bacterium]|nr:hypothetical protein [Planctomycetota bacterium]